MWWHRQRTSFQMSIAAFDWFSHPDMWSNKYFTLKESKCAMYVTVRVFCVHQRWACARHHSMTEKQWWWRTRELRWWKLILSVRWLSFICVLTYQIPHGSVAVLHTEFLNKDEVSCCVFGGLVIVFRTLLPAHFICVMCLCEMLYLWRANVERSFILSIRSWWCDVTPLFLLSSLFSLDTHSFISVLFCCFPLHFCAIRHFTYCICTFILLHYFLRQTLPHL